MLTTSSVGKFFLQGDIAVVFKENVFGPLSTRKVNIFTANTSKTEQHIPK